MRRTALLGIAAVLLLFGVGLVGWRYLSAPTTLIVAVGPAGGQDVRLITAMGQYLAHEHSSLRLKVLPLDGQGERAAAVDEGRADLAVVRTDAGLPAKAQTVAIMHRDTAVLVALPASHLTAIPDLRGRAVGVLGDSGPNVKLLHVLLAQHEVPEDDVRVVPIADVKAVTEELRSGHVDAVLAIGTVNGATVSGTVAAATAAGGAPPVFLPTSESEAIAQRSPMYESYEIVRGAFSGSPPRPAEPVKTIAVSQRLMASTALEDGTVSELTKQIFAMRPVIAREVPLANRIEGPDTSKSSSLPVHPGASAYYADEVETFFDRYDDWIYIGAMVLSVVGSALAGLASTASARRRTRTLGLLDRLLSIVRLARAAGTTAELDALEHETDEILGVALTKAGSGALDDTGVSAFTLGLEQARFAIASRRAIIETVPTVHLRQQAAE